MTTHAIHHPWAHRQARRGSSALVRAVHFLTAHYLLLPVGAAVALVWANVRPESYFTFAQAFAFPVNEVAMVFFFGLLAQEIFEETMPGGALHHWRRWPVPIVAAFGAVAGSALAYHAWIARDTTPLLEAGWPAMAGVDLAFAYFIVRAVFRRHPAVSFLILLAVTSNLIGFVAVLPTYSDLFGGARTGGSALLMAAAVGLAVWLKRNRVRAFWPYVAVCGGLSWLALYLEGLHPAIALVPIVPFMPHTPRKLGELFTDEDDPKGQVPRHFEHVWHYQVQVALLLFGLVNAGVMLNGYGPGTWAVLVGSLFGRTLGILVTVGAALAVGLHLPAHLRWRDITVVSLAASIGFTFILFFATALYPAGPMLTELKIGALLTIGGALLTVGLARLLHVGRFHRTNHARAAHHHG
jgi:NhaA family Na+:H+ antiporter